MTEKRKGEFYMFLEILLWGFFPVLTILTYKSLSPILTLVGSLVFSALFFACVIAYSKKWNELKNLLVWQYSFIVAFFLGFLFYGFYFLGLSHTTAGNAALIGQFEILTSFIFFHLIRKDFISSEYKLGALLMLLGAGIVLAPNIHSVNLGDMLVLAATFFSPVGNLYMQKARKFASAETILFLRTIFTIPMAFALAVFLGEKTTMIGIQNSVLFLLINGVFLFGLSKILWLEGIHRMPVTKALALNSTTPLITLLLGWAILSQTPNLLQLISLMPLIGGALLLTDQWRFAKGEALKN